MRQIFYEVISVLAQNLSIKNISKAGRVLGYLMWYSLPGRKKIATQAISLHLQKDQKQTKFLAKSNFQHTGRSFLELFFTRKIDYRFMQTNVFIPHPENFYPMLEFNRPIVATTAHLGSWELLAGILNLHFQNRPSQIVVRQPKDIYLSQTMTHFRQSNRVEIVHQDQASVKVLRCLRMNGITAFLVDHNCGRSKAVFLPFFKKFAAVNMGPALLAIRARALIWPIFLLRNGNTDYILQAYQPLDTMTLKGSLQDKINYAAQFYTKTVEDAVRLYPDQWFWMHKRWKTQPKSEKELQYISIAKDFSS